MEFSHWSVMPAEVVEYLGCRAGGVYVDGTLGGGGHTLDMLRASAPDGKVIGIDLDEDAIKAAGRSLEEYKDRVTLVRGNFRDIKEILEGLGISVVDGVVFDLGVSSHQFDVPERGFSFRFDTRLDMRMDRRQKVSAYELVNDLDADELAKIFRDYGEEKEAKKIARAIDKARKTRPVATTGELARIVQEATPWRHGGIHPATKVFQALRIAVNDELANLGEGLAGALASLKGGGRLVVISFQSLEDRIVKSTFRDKATGCICPPRIPVCVCGRTPAVRLLTRKALTPSEDEVKGNPRARSAKLRAIEKL
ncbi:MAG: 16S rRNA (cytosine(1402)-N(4))-methyltransferase RsmH [Deltaproteobacteria bacterium]|nr:16S rRNA (cytosine(1402)-N(4))-methyltransferase RsmH [Deltaproteobacteria bacterium]